MALAGANLAEIEAACERMSVGVGQQREEAEQYLMGIRNSPEALAIGKAIIETSNVDSACFQAACMLKEAILRDWSKLTHAHRQELKGQLLQYVIQRNATMKPFVRSQILQLVAIIVKRGWFEEPPELFVEFTNYVQALAQEEATRAVAMFMVLALLEEFSSNSRSIVGLSWEFHHKSQQRFHQEGHLKLFFSLLLSLLSASIDNLRAVQADIQNVTLPGAPLAWLSPCIAAVNHMLSWDFTDAEAKGGVLGSLKSGRGDVITPGVAWRDIFMQPSTIDLIYSCFAVCRHHQMLGHALRQCLVDLAAIRGDVFPDDAARQAYFQHSLRSVLQLVGTEQHEHEFVDVSLILLRLVTNFKAGVFLRSASAPESLDRICNFTCMLMQRERSEDISTQEALDHLFEMWSSLTLALHGPKVEVTLRQSVGLYTAKLFRTFLEKCLRDAAQEVEDWTQEDDDHEDRSVLEERLTALGCIARLAAEDACELLASTIQERISALQNIIETQKPIQEAEAGLVLEQLHWLLRLAGHLLADEGEGEVPYIPQCMGSLSLQAEAEQRPDPVEKLINTVVQLVQLEDVARKAGRGELLSPLVAQYSTWFFSRWAQTYLLPESSDLAPISNHLRRLYGPGPGAESVLSFVIGRALSNLQHWAHEDEVVTATALLLLSLAGRKPVARLLLPMQGWAHLSVSLRAQMARAPGAASVLPPPALVAMIHALCLSVAAAEPPEQRTAMLKELVGPVMVQLQGAVEVARARRGEPLAGESIVRCSSMLQGACKAADFYTYDVIFELLAPILEPLCVVLEAQRDHHDVTNAIVELYVGMAEALVSYLPSNQMSLFDRACLQLLQTFARVEGGEAAGAARGALQEARDEWLREHMLSLLQLLLHLARKDVVDFSNEGRNESMADVVLFGLSILQPLITPDALQYPPLAKEFFALFGWLVESYPHKVSTMDRAMLDPLMACLHFGLQQADSEHARVSVEAIDALATYQVGAMQADGSYPLQQKHPLMLSFFLQGLLETMLFKQFDRAVLESSCDALLSLLACEQAKFTELMTQVVQSQAMAEHRQQVTDATAALLAQVHASGPAVQRAAKMQLRTHMRTFLTSVRPFLVTI